MEQLGGDTRTDRRLESEYKQETPLELDRINFAIALRDLALFVDFEDWDGLSDYEILGLVCAHYPRHSESIVTIWEVYCVTEGNHEV